MEESNSKVSVSSRIVLWFILAMIVMLGSVSIIKAILVKDIPEPTELIDLGIIEVEPIIQEPIIQEPIIEVEPEPELTEVELIDSYTVEIGLEYGVDPAILQSMIWHESRYKADNINSIGCMGLMQICTKWHMPRAERLGVTDFLDPYQNILIGTDILADYMTKGDIGLALMLYSGNHNTAYELYRNGKLSWYATSVLDRAEMIRRGEL